MMMAQSEYIDTHYCAKMLGKAYSTVVNWRRENAEACGYRKGPPYEKNPVNGLIRYKRADVALYMRRHGGYVPGLK